MKTPRDLAGGRNHSKVPGEGLGQRGAEPPSLELAPSFGRLADALPQPALHGALVLHVAGVPLVFWDALKEERPPLEIARVPSSGTGLDGLGQDPGPKSVPLCPLFFG